jgi:hypothetical protein
MKFNIGDRVKIISNTHINRKSGEKSRSDAGVGLKGTITTYDADRMYQYTLRIYDMDHLFLEDDLELVESPDNKELEDLVAKLHELNKQSVEITKQIQQLITKGEGK